MPIFNTKIYKFPEQQGTNREKNGKKQYNLGKGAVW